MKNIIFTIAIISLGLTVLFSSCEKKVDDSTFEKDKSYEISLKLFEPEVVVKGGGDKEDYDKVIVEDFVKEESCKWEIVAGIVEFYYQNELVYSVDFGDGNCDGLATITWLKDGIYLSKVVDVWEIFGDDNKDKEKKY